MGVFLQHARGSVTLVDGPWRGAPTLRIRAGDLALDRARAIVTQAGVQMNGNFQFVHCLNDRVFVYVFGDRISELSISGLAFGTPCRSSTPGSDDVLRAYMTNRLASKGRPAIVAIGSFRFQSFLTGFSAEIADAETGLLQFSYRFHGFPQG